MGPVTRLITLLRGINVGPSTRVPMAVLRQIALDAGYTDVSTLLNSGNLVLTGDDDARTTASRVHTGLQARLGLDVDTIVIDLDELQGVVEANPFPVQALEDPAHLVVTWYQEPPAPELVAAFDPSRYGPEQMAWHNGVSYTWYPVDIGHSKLTPAVLARGLGVRAATARNWSTVLKLLATAQATA